MTNKLKPTTGKDRPTTDLVETVPADDTHSDNHSAPDGYVAELPARYYRSFRFIGSVVGVAFMANSLFLGFVLPVRPPKPFPLSIA